MSERDLARYLQNVQTDGSVAKLSKPRGECRKGRNRKRWSDVILMLIS